MTRAQFRSLSCLALAAVSLAGCSTYHDKPIDSQAVDAALASQPIDSVKVQAANLKHPLLKPVTIEGTNGFTPEEIAVMVVVVSPELKALRAQKGVAEAQVIQAGILPNPQLGWSTDRPHGNSDPTLVPAKSLALSWDLSALLSHKANVDAAKQTAQSLDLSIAWQEWQAAQDARLRAYRIVSLERQVPLAREVEEALTDSLALNRKALALGSKTLSDITQATQALATAQSARLDLEKQLSEERAALNLSLGLKPGEKVDLRAVEPSDGGYVDSLSSESLLSGMEDRRLDLVALKLGYESQQSSLRAAIWQQFPKIGLSVNKAQDTTPVKTRGFGVTVDIPLFDRNQGNIAIAQATREQLFAEYVARVAEARSQVGQIVEQLHSQWKEIALAKTSLGDAKSSAEAYDQAVKSGNADILTAREATGGYAQQQLQLLQLEQSAVELGVGLELATAQPIVPPSQSAQP